MAVADSQLKMKCRFDLDILLGLILRQAQDDENEKKSVLLKAVILSEAAGGIEGSATVDLRIEDAVHRCDFCPASEIQISATIIDRR